MSLPLEGITVLEFSQYLAGPYAGLRLADLGATVIKIERPGSGDACRQLATKNLYVDGDSLVFHTINRNKKSYAANLKDPADLEKVKGLIASADVMTHNFRPGVMEKIGLDFEVVKGINPGIVYGEVTGYGTEGPWVAKPGQDLLAQSVSGLTWLTGTKDAPPTPFGMAIGDMICGTHLAQGLLAALVRRNETGQGARIEVSLLESLLDLQFEVLTTYLNDGNHLPQRPGVNPAHAYLKAPYGIFQTLDGHIAIAMGSLEKLGGLIGLELEEAGFAERDAVHEKLAARFAEWSTDAWLVVLEPADIWCSDVLDYERMMQHPGFQTLEMKQTVARPNGVEIDTLRCPIRVDGERIFSDVAAPMLGNANQSVDEASSFIKDVEETCCVETTKLEASSTLKLPLEGKTVLDFSQFLSGPSAGLRLADLGARVIKVEQPGGDICREHYVTDVELNGESTLFHAINRNKESICLDLKTDEGKAVAEKLIQQADVLIHNFRPGVMEKLGFGWEPVHALNPDVVYGTISGYGTEGPWREKPGQDLLVQAVSGLTWLSGNAGDGPVPMGLAVADMLSGAQLAQGILAKLVSGEGGRIAVSMLEAMLDFQFEPLTVYFQDGGQAPERTASHNAHAYLGAPYGIYQTADGYLALAMGSVPMIGKLIGCEALLPYEDPASWFTERDQLKAILAEHLISKSTDEWLSVLEPADIWCAQVHDWDMLRESPAFQCLEMEQDVQQSDGFVYRTTRCPIRLDGKRIFNPKGSPKLGENTEAILTELN